MALRQVLLSYKIGEKKTHIESLRGKQKDFGARKAELNKREAELEAAINEQSPDADAETKAAVEKAVEEFTEEAEKLEKEIQENADEIEKIEAEIAQMQKELDALSETPADPAESPAEPENRESNKRSNERSFAKMKVRAFDKMNLQERAALVQRDEVKTFISRARDIITRGVQNVEITIPQIIMPMIREEVERESKMIKYVNHMIVPGEGRVPIMGMIPEAIWTEQCAMLNELDLSMYLATFSAYKVGAFYGVCRYIVEDSDENILDLLMYALAVGIAKAVDKAILFGTGRNMPLGIATRLLQTQDPGTGDSYSLGWDNLSAKNVSTITAANSTDKKLIQAIANQFAAVNSKTGKDKKFFAMNDATHMKLMTETITYTASGALVSAVQNQMPVIGGDIVIIDDIPNDIIIGGYGVNYALPERGSMSFATSEHVRWIEEQILVKATARYDGKPTNPAAFFMVGLNGVVPATAAASVTFAPDTANAEEDS